ncbi:MAG: HAD family hydrolase [Bacteroidales bacterium]|jgi:HAD superfamily hydrolase (TIGR01549 family)|nr:HAD family hydrolase [Bacteroidales bacterium]
MNPKKCLISDFDDTLVKTVPVHARCWQQTLENIGGVSISWENIMQNINHSIEYVLDIHNIKVKQDLFERMKEHKKKIFDTRLHETELNWFLWSVMQSGLFEKIYLISNSSRENVLKLMALHGIEYRVFTRIITRDDVKHRKPAPDMGHLIFNQNPEYQLADYLYIGDAPVDIEFAKGLQIDWQLVHF